LTTLLSTKKLKPILKEKLLDNDLILIERKFIKIKKIHFAAKTLNEFVIFTSKNAVKSVLKNSFESQIIGKKIFCVGKKTKEFLEKNHFIVQENAKNALDLSCKIIENYNHHSFTFFSGNIRSNILPDLLNKNNIDLNEVVVYETTLIPKKITQNRDAILFYSPSAVESYFLQNQITNETCFCIGTTTAKALATKLRDETKNIIIASQPTVEDVISEVLKYYNK
jgi:uroporphyrinogen-III synthase